MFVFVFMWNADVPENERLNSVNFGLHFAIEIAVRVNVIIIIVSSERASERVRGRPQKMMIHLVWRRWLEMQNLKNECR